MLTCFFRATNHSVFVQTFLEKISKREEKSREKGIASKTDETKWKVYDN